MLGTGETYEDEVYRVERTDEVLDLTAAPGELVTALLSIKCGHCGGRHSSADGVYICFRNH